MDEVIPRLRSGAFYHALDEHERKMYKSGLPVAYMGAQIKDLEFAQYFIGHDLNRKLCTASAQQNSLIEFANSIKATSVLSGVFGFHSYPTDDAAFKAAAAVYEAASLHPFSCVCVSTSTILHSAPKIPMSDVYLIHGVNDTPHSGAIWALRDFLRDRDGSLRLVVMASGREMTLDTLVHEHLRMRFKYLFCLKDSAVLLRDSYSRKLDPAEARSGRLPAGNTTSRIPHPDGADKVADA